MTAFTRLGSALWDWPPFVGLDDSARVLWIALYTTAEAKRHAPGLWQGGIPTIADASHQHPDVVVWCLDVLLDKGLVEYDMKTRVLRLCELPDPGEFPSNGKVIRSWWTRFKSVPECGVRDAHVPTLRWILDAGSRLSRKGLSSDHEAAWRDTFGTIAVPASRHRGVRRLADSDTGTAVQPSLFSGCNSLIESASRSDGCSVDNSGSLHQMNKNNSPETISDTVSDTNRIPDPGSRIPDPSGSSEERGSKGRGEAPFTALHVLSKLAAGPWDQTADRSHQAAIGAMIPTWVASGVGLDDFGVLADYNAYRQRVWSARALLGCDITAEIAMARKTLDWRDVQMEASLKNLP